MRDKKILLVGILLFFVPFALADPISDDNFECAGFNCGTGWINDWQYTGTCEIVTTANPIGTYHMRGVASCDALRQVDTTGYSQVLVSFYATASSLENPDHCQYYYYDGTSYHLLLDLANGDDDSTHDYYEYDVTSYGLGADAGIRMLSPTTTGDYCYIDNVAITGTVDIQFNIFTDSIYTLSETTQIEMTSSLADTSHTIELYDASDTLFCSDVIVSPSSPFTSFFTTCTMPSTEQTNAYAKLYETGTPGTATIKYFDVKPITQNDTMLQIKKAYFSPQVLQGGNTELYVLIEKNSNITIEKTKASLTFPDNTQRDFSMIPTGNLNEYKAFITDTYIVGNVSFVIRIEGGNYYDSYTGKYVVAGYNVDFVDVVNKVAEVAVCKEVQKIATNKVEQIGGTEYSANEIARTVLHILDTNGLPLNNASCVVDVRDSFNEALVNDGELEYVPNSNGLYSFEFSSLLPYGVYSVDTVCTLGDVTIYSADTFHVAGWTKDIQTAAPHLDGDYTVSRVSGTEYFIGEPAHIVIQVLQEGVPDVDADCYVSMFVPTSSFSDNLTKIVDTVSMTYLPNSNGLYVYNFYNTTYAGSYYADTACESEAGTGYVPINYTNGVTDTTTSATLEDIDGGSIGITISQTTDIVGFMSVDAEADSNSVAEYGLHIDDRHEHIYRDMGANEPGNLFIPFFYEDLPAGTYIIEGEHAISTGTLTSNVNIMGFGLEDGDNIVTGCFANVTDDNVTDNTLVDIDGLECDLVLTRDANLFIVMAFSGAVSIGGEDIFYTVSIDGVDQEVADRSFGDADSYGALNFMTLSNSELSAGTHTIKGRWYVTDGTGTIHDATLIVVSSEAGNREMSMGEGLVDSTTTTSQTPTGMGATSSVIINNDNYIAGFLTTAVSSGAANKQGNYLIDIDGTNGETFRRHFSTANSFGSVGIVETAGPFETGYYSITSKWFASEVNTLTAEDTKLISIGFSTESEFPAAYQALDFHVYNRTELGDTIALEVWNNEINGRRLTEKEQLWVGGSEYDIEEGTGKIVVRMIKNDGTPITGGDCKVQIMYSNNTVYLTNQTMTEYSGIGGMYEGAYYLDFSLSNTLGNYPYIVDCEQGGKNYYLMDKYHVRDISTEIWENDNRTLTDYREQSISDHVWNNSNRSLTYTFNIVYDVWNYVTRELTDYREQSISDHVWNNTNRSLTELNFDTTNESQVWSYFNRTLSEFGFDVTNETQVWNYNNRTLSEFNFDTTDEAAIWNYFNRTLSELNFDTTNESQVWNYINRSLTEFNFDVEVDTSNISVNVNATAVADAVWTYDGTIVDNILTQIASVIWEYLGARAEII